MRPVLLPRRRAAVARPATLQLGRGPRPAVVLAGLDPALRAVLRLLDGTHDARPVLRRGRGARAARPSAPQALLDAARAGPGSSTTPRRSAAPLPGSSRPERDRLSRRPRRRLALVRGDGGLPALRRCGAAVRCWWSAPAGSARRSRARWPPRASARSTSSTTGDGPAEDTGVGGLALGRRRAAAGRGGARAGAAARAGPRCRGAGRAPRPRRARTGRLLRRRRRGAGCCSTARRTCWRRSATRPASSARSSCPAARPACAASTSTRTDLDPAWPALAAQLSAAGAGAGRRATGRSPSPSPRRPRCRCSPWSTDDGARRARRHPRDGAARLALAPAQLAAPPDCVRCRSGRSAHEPRPPSAHPVERAAGCGSDTGRERHPPTRGRPGRPSWPACRSGSRAGRPSAWASGWAAGRRRS